MLALGGAPFGSGGSLAAAGLAALGGGPLGSGGLAALGGGPLGSGGLAALGGSSAGSGLVGSIGMALLFGIARGLVSVLLAGGPVTGALGSLDLVCGAFGYGPQGFALDVVPFGDGCLG